MPNHKVLLTGATGYIASQVLPTFREQYELTLLDVKEGDRQGNRVENVITADLIDPDLGKYTEHFQGADTVVHLGYRRRRGAPLDDFYDEQQNVAMSTTFTGRPTSPGFDGW